MKQIVQRTCMGCNAKKDKKEFIRIVLNKEGKIFIDKTGKAEGRGAYLCNNKECIEKAIKTKRLERVFNIKIDDDVLNRIRGVVIEETGKENCNQ